MTDAIRLTSGYQREHIEDVESERLTFGQQWSHQLDNGWMQILSMRWEGERFNIGEEEQGAQPVVTGCQLFSCTPTRRSTRPGVIAFSST